MIQEVLWPTEIYVGDFNKKNAVNILVWEFFVLICVKNGCHSTKICCKLSNLGISVSKKHMLNS